MIRILFFGQLKERLKKESIQVNWSEQNGELINVANLRAYLQNQGADWQEFLELGQALVAVNQEMASEDAAIADNDEIAFFPPVTGG